MTIQAEITRITEARNTMRTKLIELGLVQSTAMIDDVATAIYGIENQGAVDAEVTEGASYTIPKGYHNGSGVVKGVAGGGNYNLQQKTVTPTKMQQSVTPDSGFYGMSSVTVNAIPEQYQDISITTAEAADVLANKVFVDKLGKTTSGTMTNNGAVTQKLTAAMKSYTIPAGYHNGAGSVSVTTETKSVEPTRAEQTVEPTEGSLLESVTVSAIPAELQDVSGVTATAAQVLTGAKYVTSDGTLTTGTMPNIGAGTQTIDGLTSTSVTLAAGYYDGSGTVSLTGDIEEALAAI